MLQRLFEIVKPMDTQQVGHASNYQESLFKSLETHGKENAAQGPKEEGAVGSGWQDFGQKRSSG
jgi:hypothetical protein